MYPKIKFLIKKIHTLASRVWRKPKVPRCPSDILNLITGTRVTACGLRTWISLAVRNFGCKKTIFKRFNLLQSEHTRNCGMDYRIFLWWIHRLPNPYFSFVAVLLPQRSRFIPLGSRVHGGEEESWLTSGRWESCTRTLQRFWDCVLDDDGARPAVRRQHHQLHRRGLRFCRYLHRHSSQIRRPPQSLRGHL